MILQSATVGPFKSINTPQEVVIDAAVTVLVGMNEAGKTVFLQALAKSRDAIGLNSFDPVQDYPRKDLPSYLKRHDKEPETATVLKYQLTDDEVRAANIALAVGIEPGFTFSVLHKYSNSFQLGIDAEERPLLDSLLKIYGLSTDTINLIKKSKDLRELVKGMQGKSLTPEDTTFLAELTARCAKTKWPSVVEWELWKWIEPQVPKFLYFGEYDLLPSKMNLADLATRVESAKTTPSQVQAKHRAVLALLRMADISLSEFTKTGGYEQLKAKLEGVSISLTDQIMQFWKQNEDLEVEVDIKADPSDEAPFNNGVNLYLRIKNRRHRGVSTPFEQRSRGFVWFFSFLVWFDSVQHQIGINESKNLILLLDEPGLALHALAQADFLKYIDDLSEKHQVLYTTHSPFMVHTDRLRQVRMVEDSPKEGTLISANVSAADSRTIFPLQAALGWNMAQNLFISERNLLVEGPADLIFLKSVSAILEKKGKSGLREDVTIVPAGGGLDKVATFIALLGANGLRMAVLHDYRGTPEQRLIELVRDKLISAKAILNVAQFRDPSNPKLAQSSDLEDLLPVSLYLEYFNKCFSKSLAGKAISESGLPPGDRIVERLERYIASEGISLRPSGGFNHYLVASQFASAPPATLDAATTQKFEQLFQAVNALYT